MINKILHFLNLSKSNKVFNNDYFSIKENNTNAEKKHFYEVSINKNQYLFRAYDNILNKKYDDAIEILSNINESKNKKLMSEKYFFLACCYSNLKNKDLTIENLTNYCYYLEYVSLSRIILENDLNEYKYTNEFKSIIKLICKNINYKNSLNKLSSSNIDIINNYLEKID